MSKSALGRGLDALLGDSPEPAITKDSGSAESSISDGVLTVLSTSIKANPNQPRKSFNQAALQELAESIRSKGILQPILVEKDNSDGYTIIAGERRYRAAVLAGMEQIPVIVRTFSDAEKMEVALIENIQREDLNPIEEALAYKGIIETGNISQEKLSERIGKSRSAIANCMRLLKLSEPVQTALRDGLISAGHARAILALESQSAREELFNLIIEKKLSVREAEKQATAMLSLEKTKKQEPGRTEKSEFASVELKQVEDKLIDFFGSKVQVKGDHDKGKIEIQYYSRDDLDRIIELFNIFDVE